jgi:transposase
VLSAGRSAIWKEWEIVLSDQNIEFVAFLGLDWADQQHVVHLQKAGSNSRERFPLNQTPEALQSWIQDLRSRFGGRPVAIAVEQSRGALIYALMHVEFLHIYPVNPVMIAKLRQAFHPSGAKDDPRDADLLLDVLMSHRHHLRILVPDDVLTRSIQLLGEGRRKLVDQRTALTNQLTAALKDYFPQALAWFGDLHTFRACAFLLRWPSLQLLKSATTSSIRKFYQSQGYRGQDKLQQLLQELSNSRPLVDDEAVLLASSMMVQALVKQIPALTESIDQYDQQIAALFEKHDDFTLFTSFPGAGAALAPRLLGALGSDRNRFEFASQIQQLSGIAPVTVRSGQSYSVHWRLACPKFLRQTFQEFAAQSIPHSHWAKAYYEQQKRRGSSHHAALRALAYKWIRIIFRCWKNRTLYDETIYFNSLQRRGSLLATALPTMAK